MKTNQTPTVIPISDRESGPDCISWCQNGDLCDGKNCFELGPTIQTSSRGGDGQLTVSRTLDNKEDRVCISYSGMDIEGRDVEVEFLFDREDAHQLVLNLVRSYGGIAL